jgi:hypothetical protein
MLKHDSSIASCFRSHSLFVGRSSKQRVEACGVSEGKDQLHMNNQITYTLLARSREKSRDILEAAVYVLCTFSAILAVWQFAREPLPLAVTMPVASYHTELQDNT